MFDMGLTACVRQVAHLSLSSEVSTDVTHPLLLLLLLLLVSGGTPPQRSRPLTEHTESDRHDQYR
jgi:hypothetical protein